MKPNFLIPSLLFFLSFTRLSATNAVHDYLNSMGKIYSVVAVVVVLFVVVLLFLIRLERKIKDLENRINNE